MISSKLIELIEIHAPRLTKDVVRDLTTNPRTPGFRSVPNEELEGRVFEIFHHLGNWIGDPKAQRVQLEFEEWGSRRFDQGVHLSEIICAVIILKRHLRQYISDHGLVDASFPSVEGEYILPLHLHSLQELNVRVGEFFDEALYQLARGFETQAGPGPATI
jgi:hypothetical protein